MYIVRDRQSLSRLLGKVRFACQCKCGSILAWCQHPGHNSTWRPLCPNCIDVVTGDLFIRRSHFAWTDITNLSSYNAMGREDGVYVDVSLRGEHMTIGFAVVKDEKAQYLSFSASNHTNTSTAEHEAVLLAQHYWPDAVVFCDHQETCRKTGAVYINRARNDLAHRIARERINFKGWVAV